MKLFFYAPVFTILSIATALADPIVVKPAYELDLVMSGYEDESLFDVNASLSKAERKAHNDELIQALSAEYKTALSLTSATGVRRRESLTLKEANILLGRLESHPVAGPDATQERDKKGTIGFCFGRAYFVHIDALRSMRVNRDMVKKIWAVGTMVGSGIIWGHHVATMVKAKEGGWYVIDSYLGMVKPEVWIAKIQNGIGKKHGDVAYFVTDARRFAPASPSPYTKIDLDDPAHYYLDFFNDLREYERKRLGAFKSQAWNSSSVAPSISGKVFELTAANTSIAIDFSSVNDGMLSRMKLRKSVAAYLTSLFEINDFEVKVDDINWFGDELSQIELRLTFKSSVSASRVAEILSGDGIETTSFKVK